MSKAFTKEDGDASEQEPEVAETALPGGKNYMTPEGFEKLRSEVKHLLYTERPALVQTVSWAASNGDRSENGDYIYGKRRLREIDRRVRFLNRRLDIAEVVDPSKQQSDRVLFGATVTVLHESGETKNYMLVGVDETDVQKGRISWMSPLGSALLNAQAGDVVTFKSPKGTEELEVTAVRYS